MKLPEEIVMAYVDGELDDAARAEVLAAMDDDDEVRAQIDEHFNLRAQLQASFNSVLSEPVPDRLLEAVRGAPTEAVTVAAPAATALSGTQITDLAVAREAKREKQQSRARWSLPQFGAVAAALVIGVLVGQRVLNFAGGSTWVTRDGQLLASGLLDDALTQQVASTQTDAMPVHIGLTYRSVSGDFCRTFVLSQSGAAAGVACRSNDAWRVEMLTRIDSKEAGVYRTAGSEIPEVVRRAVEATINGDPLDATQEAAAKQGGWR